MKISPFAALVWLLLLVFLSLLGSWLAYFTFEGVGFFLFVFLSLFSLTFFLSLFWRHRIHQPSGPSKHFYLRRSLRTAVPFLLTVMLLVFGYALFFKGAIQYHKDFTEQRLFSVSERTKAVLQNLTQPVQLKLFDLEDGSPQATLFLRRLAQASPLLSFTRVNPVENFELTQRYAVKQPGTVVLTLEAAPNQWVKLRPQEMQFSTAKNDRPQVQLFHHETTLRAALLSLTAPPTTILFLGAAGLLTDDTAAGLSLLRETLSRANFELAPVKKFSTIPSAPLLFLHLNKSAMEQLPRSALDKLLPWLSAYLKAGGRFLLAFDPPDEAALSPQQKEWFFKLLSFLSLQPEERIVVDQQAFHASFFSSYDAANSGPPAFTAPIPSKGNPLFPKLFFQKHPITQPLKKNQLSPVFKVSMPLRPASTGSYFNFIPLLKTGIYAWAEQTLKEEVARGELFYTSGRDLKGPLVAAALLPGRGAYARAAGVLFGDASFLENVFFSIPANREFFLNSWYFLQGETSLIDEPYKVKTSQPLNLTKTQRQQLFLATVLFYPLLFLGFGAVLLALRRLAS